MLLKIVTALNVSLVILAFGAQANEMHHDHHAEHQHTVSEPIGVMAAHTHEQGKWMTSYRYSSMYMEGNRNGTSDVSTAQVHNDFMVAPTKMRMQMHMFGLMYGVTNDLTLMAMAPYTIKEMDHRTRMGVNFTTKSEGVGDVKLQGIYRLDQQKDRELLVNAGVSLPTGSIGEKDATPMGPNQQLPYAMQLGSGTWDPIVGATYKGHHGKWGYGVQAGALIRLGKNDRGYRLGNEYHATTWVSRQLNDTITSSFRLDAKEWGDVDGADTALNPAMVPTARTDLRGGRRVDALLGMNIDIPGDTLDGSEVALEVGLPIYQHLDGPQLETDSRVMLGIKLRF